MRCQELKAFRWWIRFERARLYEIRRRPDSETLYNLMAASELALHESHIHSPDLVERLRRLKRNHEDRRARRTKVAQHPMSIKLASTVISVFGRPPDS